jgi:hypothetical protein
MGMEGRNGDGGKKWGWREEMVRIKLDEDVVGNQLMMNFEMDGPDPKINSL